MTRYAEALAAFRHPLLWPVDPSGNDDEEPRDLGGALVERRDVLEMLSPSSIAQLQQHLESTAAAAVAQLPTNQTVELFRDFAQPWCHSLAMTITGSDASDREQLSRWGDRALEGGAAKDESLALFKRHFANSAVPLAQQTFLGISQTTPRLLVNSWLALLRHPAEVKRLRADLGLMPRAVEELLRYAGIIPTLFRRAREAVDLGKLHLADGDRVHLMIAVANRDPAQFSDPDQIDVTRRATGQLALGLGRSSCAGAWLVRAVLAAGTSALLRRFGSLEVVRAGPEIVRTGFSWSGPVHVRLFSTVDQLHEAMPTLAQEEE